MCRLSKNNFETYIFPLRNISLHYFAFRFFYNTAHQVAPENAPIVSPITEIAHKFSPIASTSRKQDFDGTSKKKCRYALPKHPDFDESTKKISNGAYMV